MLILEGLCGSVHRELDLERQVARLCVLPAPLTAEKQSQKICALRVKMLNLSLKINFKIKKY